jgi:hypothetical protein
MRCQAGMYDPLSRHQIPLDGQGVILRMLGARAGRCHQRLQSDQFLKPEAIDTLHNSDDNAFTHVRKPLNIGEMSEWSIEHAWKAMSWSHIETYQSTFSAAPSTT